MTAVFDADKDPRLLRDIIRGYAAAKAEEEE
jgi:hypothetical protein